MIEFLTLIPLELADQQKLESFVRKIPVALIRAYSEGIKEFRTYSFPRMNDKGLKIECESLHFYSSQFPSESSCRLSLLNVEDLTRHEQVAEIRDPFVVQSFFEALSFGRSNTKSLYSNERVYGVNAKGVYAEHFRYSFTCSPEKCQVTMSTKPH